MARMLLLSRCPQVVWAEEPRTGCLYDDTTHVHKHALYMDEGALNKIGGWFGGVQGGAVSEDGKRESQRGKKGPLDSVHRVFEQTFFFFFYT